jgi:hypothetical protein
MRPVQDAWHREPTHGRRRITFIVFAQTERIGRGCLSLDRRPLSNPTTAPPASGPARDTGSASARRDGAI